MVEELIPDNPHFPIRPEDIEALESQGWILAKHIGPEFALAWDSRNDYSGISAPSTDKRREIISDIGDMIGEDPLSPQVLYATTLLLIHSLISLNNDATALANLLKGNPDLRSDEKTGLRFKGQHRDTDGSELSHTQYILRQLIQAPDYSQYDLSKEHLKELQTFNAQLATMMGSMDVGEFEDFVRKAYNQRNVW